MLESPRARVARVLQHPLARVGVVALMTLGFYITAGILAYVSYSVIAGVVYDESTREGLTALKVGFYACYGAQLLVTFVSGVVLARRLGASLRLAIPVIVSVLLLLVYPTLGFASFMSECDLGASVPLEGSSC